METLFDWRKLSGEISILIKHDVLEKIERDKRNQRLGVTLFLFELKQNIGRKKLSFSDQLPD